MLRTVRKLCSYSRCRFGISSISPVQLSAEPHQICRVGTSSRRLSDAANSQSVRLRIVDRISVKRRSTTGAERLRTFCATLTRLDIDLRRPGPQAEVRYQRRHRDSIRRTGERLAIGAMTYRHARRVDDRFIRYVATVAGTLYLHEYLTACGRSRVAPDLECPHCLFAGTQPCLRRALHECAVGSAGSVARRPFVSEQRL